MSSVCHPYIRCFCKVPGFCCVPVPGLTSSPFGYYFLSWSLLKQAAMLNTKVHFWMETSLHKPQGSVKRKGLWSHEQHVLQMYWTKFPVLLLCYTVNQSNRLAPDLQMLCDKHSVICLCSYPDLNHTTVHKHAAGKLQWFIFGKEKEGSRVMGVPLQRVWPLASIKSVIWNRSKLRPSSQNGSAALLLNSVFSTHLFHNERLVSFDSAPCPTWWFFSTWTLDEQQTHFQQHSSLRSRSEMRNCQVSAASLPLLPQSKEAKKKTLRRKKPWFRLESVCKLTVAWSKRISRYLWLLLGPT